MPQVTAAAHLCVAWDSVSMLQVSCACLLQIWQFQVFSFSFQFSWILWRLPVEECPEFQVESADLSVLPLAGNAPIIFLWTGFPSLKCPQ